MAKQVTVNDIAEHLGVSRSTVSLVLQESPLVAERTRERVQAAAEELGYIYNRAAASLRSLRSGTVGLIITSVGNPFFAEITVGVEQAFESNGKTLLLGQHSESLDNQARLVNTMLESRVDGLILVPAPGSSAQTFKRLSATKIPVVLLTRRVEGTNFGYVGSNVAFGAQKAMNHLIEHGKKSFYLLGGREGSSSQQERLEGMQAAALEHGFSIDDVRVIGRGTSRSDGYSAMAALIDSGVTEGGILAYNDIVAFGAMAAMKDRGVTPGEAFSIIGVDNIESAKYENPGLTTIAVKPTELGAKAAEQLSKCMDDAEDFQLNVIESNELVIRQSCGCNTEGIQK